MGVQVLCESGRATSPLTATDDQITGYQRIHAKIFPDVPQPSRSDAKLQVELYLWEIHLFGSLLTPNQPFEDWLRGTMQ